MSQNSPIINQHSEVPSRSLHDALNALIWHSKIEIEPGRLLEGIPLPPEGLTVSLLDRCVDRLGYKLLWITTKSLETLPIPCCLKLSENEYCIVVSKNEAALYTLDNADIDSYQKISVDKFNSNFVYRAFQLIPSTDLLLEAHSTQENSKHWFWSRLLGHNKSLIDIIIGSLFANVLAVFVSLFAMQVFDRVIPAQSEATLWVLAGGVLLAIIFEAILKLARARLIDRVGKEAEIEIYSDIFHRMISMKLDKRPASPGAIVSMVREFSGVKEFFTNTAVGVVADLPFAFIFLLLLYGIAGNVVWIIVLGAVLIVIPNIALQGKMLRLSNEAQGGMSSASRLLTEVSYGLETVKVTQSESDFQGQWEEIIGLNAVKTSEQRALRAFLTYWAAGIQQATYVFAVITSVYLVFSAQLSTGAIIAIGILTTRTLSPVSQLSQALSSWQNMKSALDAVEAVVNAEQERNDERTYIRRPRLHGSIAFERVRFSHSPISSLALDVSRLNIESGTRLALLGPNGAGKSTLLRLASGLVHTVEGEINLDGLDLRQIDPGDLRRNIGYLPQEILMFRGSLRMNLTSRAGHRSDDELFQALDFGGLSEFVKRHPEGLDLQIEDGGQGLSVGQRQSIGLARIHLQDPSIILMDEPTSALDQNLEKEVVERIGKWVGARTCVVATHRPTILSQMTHIAVLQHGRIIMTGERDAVLNKLMAPPPSAERS